MALNQDNKREREPRGGVIQSFIDPKKKIEFKKRLLDHNLEIKQWVEIMIDWYLSEVPKEQNIHEILKQKPLPIGDIPGK